MKVYLAKQFTGYPMYGGVPDLTQEDDSSVNSFALTDEEAMEIDALFVDPVNNACDTALDLGDYQFYNAFQCELLLRWVEEAMHDDSKSPLFDFFSKIEGYLKYAIDNNTGIAIEL